MDNHINVGDAILVVIVETDGASHAMCARVIDSYERTPDDVLPGFGWQTTAGGDVIHVASFSGVAYFKDEGVCWARGHDDETAGALLAAHALWSGTQRSQPQSYRKF
jgi:hypothetical protein